MKPRHAITPTDKGQIHDWRKTNPTYETSEPRKVRINGRECVEIDAGKLYDMATSHIPAEKGA